MDKHNEKQKASLWTISPLLVFLGLYLVTSLVVGDFYAVPITVAFLASSVYAIATTRGIPYQQRIEIYSAGAGNSTLMLMMWLFILAGGFTQTARAIGAVDATVNLTLQLLPSNFLLPGIFIAACFISFAMGTSVGTVAALTPVAVGIAQQTAVPLPMMVAIVVGGAYFGDNLSFISDTTIIATRSMGCKMRDKFQMNALIVTPAALAVALYYLFYGLHVSAPTNLPDVDYVKVIPYFVVLLVALLGVDVIIVLCLGITATLIVGIASGCLSLFDWCGAMGTGITGMGELIVISLMAGGMLALIRYNGGIDYIIGLLTRRVHTKRGAELSIAALVSIADLCTANNTIALVTVGSIANDIAERYGIDKRRGASLLDTFSCMVQGLIPYGAQLLMAAAMAGISPLSIVAHLYYPMAMGLCALASILFRK